MIEDLSIGFTKNGKQYNFVFGTSLRTFNQAGKESFLPFRKTPTEILELKKQIQEFLEQGSASAE